MQPILRPFVFRHVSTQEPVGLLFFFLCLNVLVRDAAVRGIKTSKAPASNGVPVGAKA